MQKRPWLIAAAAAVLGLGVGFYLHRVAASHGFSARALIGRMVGFKPEPPAHAAVVMLGDSITEWTDWNALLPSFDVANRGIAGDTTLCLARSSDDTAPLPLASMRIFTSAVRSTGATRN
jgi:hypothetical protein